MKLFRYASIAAVALFVAAPAMAQDNENATYEVQPVNEVNVTTGSPSLVIRSAADFANGVQDANSTYRITTNQTAKRIQVQIDAVMANDVTLTVDLEKPVGATSASQASFTSADLANAPKDVVNGFGEIDESGLGITYGLSAAVTAGVVPATTINVLYTVIDNM